MVYKLVHSVKTIPVKLVKETLQLELEIRTTLSIEHWTKTRKMQLMDFYLQKIQPHVSFSYDEVGVLKVTRVIFFHESFPMVSKAGVILV